MSFWCFSLVINLKKNLLHKSCKKKQWWCNHPNWDLLQKYHPIVSLPIPLPSWQFSIFHNHQASLWMISVEWSVIMLMDMVMIITPSSFWWLDQWLYIHNRWKSLPFCIKKGCKFVPFASMTSSVLDTNDWYHIQIWYKIVFITVLHATSLQNQDQKLRVLLSWHFCWQVISHCVGALERSLGKNWRSTWNSDDVANTNHIKFDRC